MRIAVSLLNFRPGNIGGTETYLRQLVACLPGQRGSDTVVVVAARDVAREVAQAGLELAVVDRGDREIVAARILEAFTPHRARFAERAFERVGADVSFFPQQSIFPKAVAGPCVMTAVDVQHLYFPQYFGLFDTWFRRALYPWSLRRADRVVAISEFTRSTLIDRCGAPPEKVVTVPLGVSAIEPARYLPLEGVPRPYLYYPAAALPHKNHAALLRSFAALRRRGGLDAHLVLTGRQTALWPKLQRLAASLGIAERVLHLGFVPFEQVRRLYVGAEAVVFPTQFEGFGLPAVEAIEFGRRVIVSRLEVFDEIGLPAENQIDFDDPDQLARALALPAPTALLKAPLSWEQMTARTLAVIRETHERARRRDGDGSARRAR